jgi:hypothetical protein
MTKSAKIRRLLAKNLTAVEIAKQLKIPANYVYTVKWLDKKNKKQTPVYKKAKKNPKAKAWHKKNRWFGADEKKTAYALGLHEKLVNEGVDPKSDKYYEKVDEGMKAFNKPKKPLTATQKAIAKKLGLTQKPTKLIIQPQHKDTAMKLLAELDAAEKKPQRVMINLARRKDGAIIDLNKGGEVISPPDLVNKPPHYTDGGVDTLKFIEAKDLNYRLGNVVKYVSRAGKKMGSDPVQDLEKARFYLEREIAARKSA